MPLKKSPGSDALRPLKTIQDEQRLTPTPRRRPLPVPAPDIFDEPSICVRVNRLWWSHVSGAIDVLSSEELWAGDAEEQARALRQIAKLLIPDEGCMPDFDCGDVEDCLETSTIINQIENDVQDIENEVQDLQEDSSINNVDIPEPETMSSDANDLCKSANYIALQVAARMLELWAEALSLNLMEFTSEKLGNLFWSFEEIVDLWQFIVAATNPDLADDAQAYIENIKNWFFCAELDLAQAKTFIQDDSTIPTDEKALWITILDNYNQAQIDELAAIGTLDTATPDCSEGCPWIVVWDFGGNYVPVGDETLIIPGDTWTTDFADFVPGNGYVANGDQMYIYKTLPAQCRLNVYQVSVAKVPAMTALDVNFYWRGSSGTGSPQYSPGIRMFSNVYTTMTFTVLGNPLMPTAAIVLDAFLGSAPFGQRCEWIKLVGTGAYPQS